jgi:hypothetical protein
MFSIVVAGSLIASCGSKDDERDNSGAITPINSSTSFVTDSNVAEQSVQANMDDALEALADSSISTTTLGAALLGNSSTTSMDKENIRKCEEVGQTAVVTVSRLLDRSRSLDLPRRTFTLTHEGENSLVRTWSNSSAAIVCNDAKKYAKIDWDSQLTGLALEAAFTRSLTISGTVLNKKTNVTTTVSNSHSAEGKRNISWTAHTEDATAGTVTEEKTISSSVTRKHTVTNKKGETVNMQLTVATKDGSPLVVNAVHDKTTKALKEKTIKSGVMVATRTGDGKMESTFDNFKLTFTAGSCSFAAGTVTVAIYKEGEATAAKTYKLEVSADGETVLTDTATSTAATDFNLSPCSMEEFNY